MNRSSSVLLSVLTATIGASPPIRYDPRVVDPGFASRLQLCAEPPARDGIDRANDNRRSVEEFVGPELVEILVHQVGDSFGEFQSVEQHIRQVLVQRPHVFSEHVPWAEGTPLARVGILGTLRYRQGQSGRLEIAGSHLCLQDSTGRVWWARVAPVDVWPPQQRTRSSADAPAGSEVVAD